MVTKNKGLLELIWGTIPQSNDISLLESKIAEFLEFKMHAIATLEALSRVYVQFAWQLECV